ncbi:uncharacterized protein LOC106055990 isoform X1 [Biomphalaria glabrata]|uniref:Uncharacterized protein LOC106055990 isoform X1 n=2 Tax=Biomphalaria glabrata TaxID=6526 RepID=A0A9W2ZE12_BIOGL|nr:uncharacterized protein LOC106055990 isoform X1 [Biomphalaria glabrata]
MNSLKMLLFMHIILSETGKAMEIFGLSESYVTVTEADNVTMTCSGAIFFSRIDKVCTELLELVKVNKQNAETLIVSYPRVGQHYTKPVQDTWILHLKGHTDVQGQCSNVKTMYIAINIPEIQLQDAGKYVCRVYFPNETHPINTSTNLLVNSPKTVSKFFIWDLMHTDYLKVSICNTESEARVTFGCGGQERRSRLVKKQSCITLTLPTNSETDYCYIDSDGMVTAQVLYGYKKFYEVFMAIPESRWGTKYLTSMKIGSATLFSAESINVNVYPDKHRITLSSLKHHSIDIDDKETGNIESKSWTSRVFSSSVPFGVIVYEIFVQLHIETVLPEVELDQYEYISYCIGAHVCDCIVYAPAVQTFDVHDMKSQSVFYYTSSVSKETFVLHFGPYVFHSNQAMQIVVSIQGRILKDAFLCTVVPSNLFLAEYLATLPEEYAIHFLIILIPDNLDVIMLNNQSLSSFDDKNEIDSFLGLKIWQVNLQRESHSPFNMRSTVGNIFGCYMFGYGNENSYSTPINFGNESREFIFQYQTQLTHSTMPTSELATTSTESVKAVCTPTPQKNGDEKDNDCDGYIDEEIMNGKDDDEDGEIDEDNSRTTDSGCLHGWFGTHCDKKCRCEKNKCQASGECKENVSCIHGFFGSKCQHKDLIMKSNVSQEAMQFRHSTKCKRNFKAVSPLSIRFPASTRISWIQIEAVSTDSLKDIQMHFLKTSRQCYTGHCLDRRDIPVENDTLIIICNITDYVCQLNISFHEPTYPRRWCAVYVSAGRNFALGGDVNMSSYYKDTKGVVSRALLSVDGTIKKSESLCSTTDINDKRPVWRVSFHSPVVIHEIVIHFRVTALKETFAVNLFNPKDQVIYTYRGVIRSKVSILYKARIDSQTQHVEVSIHNSNSVLSICEFEAYGECAPPFYGIECTELCSLSCVDLLCTDDGYCYHCANGTGGAYCFDGCLEWCVEYEELTNTAYSTTRAPSAPYQKQSGFQVENFWFYFMTIPLLCFVCFLECLRDHAHNRDVESQPSQELATVLSDTNFTALSKAKSSTPVDQ